MHKYKNAHTSGVAYYEAGKDFIVLQFSDGTKYLYNNIKPGEDAVEKMKTLAQQGKGLATFVNKNVRENYFEKLK